MVNIPWVDENQVQAFFEMMILMVLMPRMTPISKESPDGTTRKWQIAQRAEE